jgi:hypothetical protein
LDIVAGASLADIGAVVDVGAVYVWAGGAGLSGNPSLTATLYVPGSSANDWLGIVRPNVGDFGSGIQFADITGDQTLDIIVGACGADVGGVVDSGAVFVWAGGGGLSGNKPPTATFTVPGAGTGDFLCDSSGQGILIADVTGDGILDVVVGSMQADVLGVTDAGAVYVWAGAASLSGTTAPVARLYVNGASTGDQLGYISSHGQGIVLADITGDGLLEIIAGAQLADRGATTDTGAIYLWFGGQWLNGYSSQKSVFMAPNAQPNDKLGN